MKDPKDIKGSVTPSPMGLGAGPEMPSPLPTTASEELSEDDFEHAQEQAFRKKLRKHRNREPEVSELNLTAMMDMLTILLVYLLKSYNTSPAVNISQEVAPPVSSSRLEMKEATTIIIGRDVLMVDDKPIVQLSNFQLRPDDVQGSGAAKTIAPLYDVLLAAGEKQKAMHARGLAPEFEGKVLVVGDKNLPYELLSSVLYTAGQAQMANFHFVVLKNS